MHTDRKAGTAIKIRGGSFAEQMRASNIVTTILHDTRSSKETSPNQIAIPNNTTVRDPVTSAVDPIEMMPIHSFTRRVDTETGLGSTQGRQQAPIAAVTIGEESATARPMSTQQRGDNVVKTPNVWTLICVLVLVLASLQILLALSLSGAGGALASISPFIIYGSIGLVALGMITAVRDEIRSPSDETIQ